MISTNPYPVFLSLADRQCTVAGLGETGCRKLSGLLEAGADNILALDLKPEAELSREAANLIANAAVNFENRAFAESDAKKSFLVFAATSSHTENLRIARLCANTTALCNCVSAPEAGSFILPATARQGRLCAALCTNGQSPYLARQWRAELEDWLKPREKVAWLMGRLRGPVLALGLEHSHNSRIFRKIADSPIPHWLEHGDLRSCQEWLAMELPAEIHPELPQIFTDYANAFA